MLRYHPQDRNQCPLFDDLKICVKMRGICEFFLPKKFIWIGWYFWSGFAMTTKVGSRRTKILLFFFGPNQNKSTCPKPICKVIDLSIYSWFSWFTTSTSVGYHSNQNCFVANWANQRTARVTLTSIFTRGSDVVLFFIFSLFRIVRKTSAQFIFIHNEFFIVGVKTKRILTFHIIWIIWDD